MGSIYRIASRIGRSSSNLRRSRMAFPGWSTSSIAQAMPRLPTLSSERPEGSPPGRLHRWQSARSWALLIREAEALWRVDVRVLHRLAAQELLQLVQEVPPRLRRRVNRWLEHLHVATRLR